MQGTWHFCSNSLSSIKKRKLKVERKEFRRGIEPGSSGWKARLITIRPWWIDEYKVITLTKNCHSIKVHRFKIRINWNPPPYFYNKFLLKGFLSFTRITMLLQKKISPYCARHKPNNWQHPTNTRELELSSKKAGNMGLTFMFCSRVSKHQEYIFSLWTFCN